MENYKLRNGDRDIQLSATNKYEAILESLYKSKIWRENTVKNAARNKRISDEELEKLEYHLQVKGWIILPYTLEE